MLIKKSRAFDLKPSFAMQGWIGSGGQQWWNTNMVTFARDNSRIVTSSSIVLEASSARDRIRQAMSEGS
ncbi:hypothetical protein ACVIIV_003196 [Bradyrhizobium sp. USDA 4354]